MLRALLSAADGIRLVSTRGPCEVGSGQSSMPMSCGTLGELHRLLEIEGGLLPPSSLRCHRSARARKLGGSHLCPAPERTSPRPRPQRRRRAAQPPACRCRSSAKTTDGRHLRLAGAHRRLQLRRARPDAGVAHFAARERRVGEVRHPVGADALGPVQPRLLLGGGELLAGGVPRRWQGPARLEGPLERSRVRVNSGGPVPVSPARESARDRGNSGRRGCAGTGSKPQLRRAATPTPTRSCRRPEPIPPAVGPTVGTAEPPEQPATVTPRTTTAAAHRSDGRKIPRCDTTRPRSVALEGMSPATSVGLL